MKKYSLAIATALLVSTMAHAEVIKCVFTEPFIDTTYDTAKSTLTTNGEGTVNVRKNISFQIVSAGVFQLVDKDGKVIQTLSLNNNGSDGMSDAIYPYEVKDARLGDSAANLGLGGCSSTLLPTTQGEN